MATEKIGIYRRWLEKIPEKNGKLIPKSDWPKCRKHSWTVRWFGSNGKRYSKSFESKKYAEQFARNLQEDVNRGKADRPEKISLHDYIAEHERIIQGQVSYATVIEQIHKLRLFEKFIGGKILLSNIKARDAEAFIAERLASGISPATANKDIRTLRRTLNLAIEPRGYLKEGQNPFSKIKQRKMTFKQINYLSIDKYRILLKFADSLWWKAFISTAYCCGLRKSEILNLVWSDIDFENRYIHINPKENRNPTIEWEPKDHECRVVPMPDETTQLLADLQAESPVGFSYVFISPERLSHIKNRIQKGNWNTKCETVNNTMKNFSKICEKAGITKSSIHDLRRSAINNCAQHLPIQVVQQFAGHSNITTTRQYYLAVRPENMASASEVMNRMLQEVNSGLTQK
jgi:integrase